MTVSAKYLLNQITLFKQLYPNAIEFIDKSREKDLLKGKTWPDGIYYPRSNLHNAVQATQTNFYALSTDATIRARCENIYKISEIAHVLYNWRRTKKIYKFSPELTKMLLAQADATDPSSMQLPMELLTSLPHQCFFIEADFSKDTFGSMVMLDYNNIEDIIFFQAFNMNRVYLDKENSKRLGVPECTDLSLLPGKTIGECMNHDTKKLLSIYNRNETEFTFNRQKADRHQMRLITFVLYLISKNADIQKDPEQAKIYRERSSTSVIKDKLREVEIMNVGFNIGADEDDNGREWDCSNDGDKLSLNWVHKNESSDEDKQIKILEQTIADLRKENSSLKAESYEFARKARDLERELTELKAEYENDKKELTSLREFIFNIQNLEYVDEDEDTSIEFPYTTSRRITVFGGHSSWVKKIKPMLPNVRFIDTNMAASISDSIIKNSDIIWVQNNSISHAKYYQIINVSRAYNIPIRYFAYASSRKCAEQLVKDDLNHQ